MSDEVTVRVEGLNTLVRTLKKAGGDIDEMKDAHQRVSDMVASEAAMRAPRRTGKLASSVRGTRQVRRARVAVGRASVPWAGPIHWGWPARHIEAQPFIVDAAHATEPRWFQMYLDDVQKALDQVKGA